jgi:hypothetical protein
VLRIFAPFIGGFFLSGVDKSLRRGVFCSQSATLLAARTVAKSKAKALPALRQPRKATLAKPIRSLPRAKEEITFLFYYW